MSEAKDSTSWVEGEGREAGNGRKRGRKESSPEYAGARQASSTLLCSTSSSSSIHPGLLLRLGSDTVADPRPAQLAAGSDVGPRRSASLPFANILHQNLIDSDVFSRLLSSVPPLPSPRFSAVPSSTGLPARGAHSPNQAPPPDLLHAWPPARQQPLFHNPVLEIIQGSIPMQLGGISSMLLNAVQAQRLSSLSSQPILPHPPTTSSIHVRSLPHTTHSSIHHTDKNHLLAINPIDDKVFPTYLRESTPSPRDRHEKTLINHGEKSNIGSSPHRDIEKSSIDHGEKSNIGSLLGQPLVATVAPVRLGGSSTLLPVLMEGRCIGRRLNLQEYTCYASFAKGLRDMLICMHENSFMDSRLDYGRDEPLLYSLDSAIPGYKIAYEDNEGDLLLAGDLSWRDFVRVAKKIKILPKSSKQIKSNLYTSFNATTI